MSERPEVVHDRRLLELLIAEYDAASAVDTAAERIREAVTTAYVDYRYFADVKDPDRPYHPGTRVPLRDLPDGTAYTQSKTYTRGEAGLWVRDVSSDTEWSVGKRRLTTQEAVTRAEALGTERAAKLLATLADARVARAAATDEVMTHEQGYTGWSRFFLVTSSAGHVHRSMRCSTCYLTTTFAPVVDLSGLDDTVAVEALGDSLCTVCFPDAPVAGKVKKLTKAQAKKLVAAHAATPTAEEATA
jgi:hypothetical protein